jgi:alkylated DNA repair dioxygenase AlkB
MITNIVNEINHTPSMFYYIPNFLTKEEEKIMFEYLQNTNDFVENPKFNIGVSRLQKWYHVDKKYFCSSWKERYPQWMSFEMDSTVINIIKKVQEFANGLDNISVPQINSCLINKYPTGENFIAPHRDSEISFGVEPTIIGLSLGHTRAINFHRLDNSKKDFSFELESGSVFIMAGSSQRFYHHSIDKCECDSVRYSLTFREFIN